MRPVTKSVLQFLFGFLVVLLVSAFLAPWLADFLPFKFDRILRRLIMIGSIILGVGLLAERREILKGFGLGKGKAAFKLAGNGFLWGVAMVVGISLIQWALGARLWKPHETDFGRWIGLFLKGFGSGVAIGVIEEFFFRGFVFLTLKELWNSKASLVVTNLIYALSHFFPKGKVFVGPDPTFWDSFRIYQAFFPPLAEWIPLLPAILGLFLFGLILSFAYLRSGTLFPSMGIHAGCVFSLKLNRRFIPEISDQMNFWTGSKNLYDGIVGVIVLAILSLWLSCPPSSPGKEK